VIEEGTDVNTANVENGEETDANSGWIIISDQEQGFDLLTLQDGVFKLLAEANLTVGIYTQIRLRIVDENDEYGEPKTYVKVEGEKQALTIPSGTKSGLKLAVIILILLNSVFIIPVAAETETLGTYKVTMYPCKSTYQRLPVKLLKFMKFTSIDYSGNPQARNNALDCVRIWGRVAFVGEGNLTTINPSPQMLHKQLTVIGSWVFGLWELRELADFLVRQDLHPESMVTQRFPHQLAFLG